MEERLTQFAIAVVNIAARAKEELAWLKKREEEEWEARKRKEEKERQRAAKWKEITSIP